MKNNMKKTPKTDKKRLTGKQAGLVVLCSVLALILVLMILGTVYVESLMNLINRDVDNSTLSADEYEAFLATQETEEPHPDAIVVDPGDVQWGGEADLLETSDNIVNILLIGQDRRPGEGRQRSDAMILCTINREKKTLTMTSFMRDMYVRIPGYYDNRINACYQLGGMELLNECLEKNFGVQVDGNVEVDFNGFKDIVELIGGVDIELTDAEANHLNAQHGYALSSGMQRLNGEQALSYSRIRYVGNGDFGRTNRQRVVLAALVNECRNLSLMELNNLLKGILPMVTTDMSNADIFGYALDMFPLLMDLQIVTQRIPADGAYYQAMINKMAVLVPDLEANRQLLEDSLAE